MICLIFFLTCSIVFASKNEISATYDFDFLQNQWIVMPDGIKLSVTYWKPKAKFVNEKFPLVFEIHPYRKDDSGYTTDYDIYAYLARRGIAGARIDLRGTGSSEGKVPHKEYSKQELTDITEIIKQFSNLPWTNGNIGMQGISWSAFNSIITAMQRPPALKGILLAHGSEDLYANDIHTIDGALHIDIFSVEIETDNLLPQSPNYLLNKSYYFDRFNQKPWIFTYLHHQRDGNFWKKNSLRENYSAINIPIFAFASLLDGYKDYAINMLNHVNTPLKVMMGPQTHAWPNNFPGPFYEWRQLAARWWQQILNGNEDGILNEPKLTFFMRDSTPPSLNLENLPGTYHATEWPLKSTHSFSLFLNKEKKLSETIGESAIDRLDYKPSVGVGLLNWWGEQTPDMSLDDKNTLVYDSEILKEDLNIVGNPAISLFVSASAPLADWIVKLEDVNPDGSVSFVTGGLMNASQRDSRIHPTALTPEKTFTLHFPLHFTTWKFAKGHRIHLTISNAQFPMIWPTPYKMTTTLLLGNKSSQLTLPLVDISQSPKAKLPELEPQENAPNAFTKNSFGLTPYEIKQDNLGNVTAIAQEGFTLIKNGNQLKSHYKVSFQVNDLHPENVLFIGEGMDVVFVAETHRVIKVQSTTRIHSDLRYFHTSVIRKVFENGNLLTEKTWQEDIPRDFQ